MDSTLRRMELCVKKNVAVDVNILKSVNLPHFTVFRLPSYIVQHNYLLVQKVTLIFFHGTPYIFSHLKIIVKRL